MLRQTSATTCTMLTPSSRSVDESLCLKQVSLLAALTIEPLDDESLHNQSCLSAMQMNPVSTKGSSSDLMNEPRLAPTSPLRKVARNLSWSNMDIPVHPTPLDTAIRTSPRKHRPTSPSRKQRQTAGSTRPRRKPLSQKSSSFSNLATSIALPEMNKGRDKTRHCSPLQRLAKQFSLKTLRNLSPLKNRDCQPLKKQASMFNLTSTPHSPKKTRQKRANATLKKERSVVNLVKSTKTKKLAREPTSLSKHLSDINLCSSETTDEYSFAESSVQARKVRRCLTRAGSSSRSFRPVSLRNLKAPSLRSLCSAAETSAVDTSTPEAALEAQEQVRSCSPVRGRRDLLECRSAHSPQPSMGSALNHSRHIRRQAQRRESLGRSSFHEKASTPLRHVSSAQSPKRQPREERNKLKTAQGHYQSPKRSAIHSNGDIPVRTHSPIRSQSPLRNSYHGNHRSTLSPTTRRASLSQSVHGSPRKIRDMKHPPQTKDNRMRTALHCPKSPIVAPMTPTSQRKKYDSMASLADEYDKIVSISLD